MKRISIGLSLLVVCLVTSVQAQAPAPQPDPEFKKLQVLVGHWTYDGEYKAGPWGPATKIKGEWAYQFILNGFVLQGHCTEKSAEGETHSSKSTSLKASLRRLWTAWLLTCSAPATGHFYWPVGISIVRCMFLRSPL